MGVAWGLLSTARIGLAIVHAARHSNAADIVAVASRNCKRAQAFADAHGIPRAHGSYEALLADPAVEAVYVGLPNSMHCDWTLRALRAGKHVLCEKPMDRRPHRVAHAYDVAEQEDLVLSEGLMWRHHPQTTRLRELLDGRAIGDVHVMRASFSFALPPGLDVRWDPALDGGALMDVGCYCVDAARLVAGNEPTSVFAYAVAAPSGVDVRMSALLRFESDMLAMLDYGLDVTARGELEIAGTDGRLLLADPWHCFAPGIVLERDGVKTLPITTADSYLIELEDMGAAIRGERSALIGRANALGQARTIEALYRSAAEGRAIRL